MLQWHNKVNILKGEKLRLNQEVESVRQHGGTKLTKKHIFSGVLVGSVTGVTAGIVAGLVAGIVLEFMYNRYIHEQQMHKRLKSISGKAFKKHEKCLIIWLKTHTFWKFEIRETISELNLLSYWILFRIDKNFHANEYQFFR